MTKHNPFPKLKIKRGGLKTLIEGVTSSLRDSYLGFKDYTKQESQSDKPDSL